MWKAIKGDRDSKKAFDKMVDGISEVIINHWDDQSYEYKGPIFSKFGIDSDSDDDDMMDKMEEVSDHIDMLVYKALAGLL